MPDTDEVALPVDVAVQVTDVVGLVDNDPLDVIDEVIDNVDVTLAEAPNESVLVGDVVIVVERLTVVELLSDPLGV